MKIILALLLVFPALSSANTKAFRLHLSNEPGSLDPNRQKTSASSYLLGNLYRNIFTFDDQKGLVPDLGSGCTRDKKKNLTCRLKKDLRWSDGTPLTSEDFLRSYKKDSGSQIRSPACGFAFQNQKGSRLLCWQSQNHRTGNFCSGCPDFAF
ncbi:hypothetical protein [Bdellovibrio bacteriovorus]|uniref:hypothetical protein n=1 Tax=Bdellovibrio bacteriovorus TaxID=959 RepID=UPI0035A5CB12